MFLLNLYTMYTNFYLKFNCLSFIFSNSTNFYYSEILYYSDLLNKISIWAHQNDRLGVKFKKKCYFYYFDHSGSISFRLIKLNDRKFTIFSICALLWVYMTRINIFLKKHSVFMSKKYIFKQVIKKARNSL